MAGGRLLKNTKNENTGRSFSNGGHCSFNRTSASNSAFLVAAFIGTSPLRGAVRRPQLSGAFAAHCTKWQDPSGRTGHLHWHKPAGSSGNMSSLHGEAQSLFNFRTQAVPVGRFPSFQPCLCPCEAAIWKGDFQNGIWQGK